jgi:hypothetical protein
MAVQVTGLSRDQQRRLVWSATGFEGVKYRPARVCALFNAVPATSDEVGVSPERIVQAATALEHLRDVLARTCPSSSASSLRGCRIQVADAVTDRTPGGREMWKRTRRERPG